VTGNGILTADVNLDKTAVRFQALSGFALGGLGRVLTSAVWRAAVVRAEHQNAIRDDESLAQNAPAAGRAT
jgi:hypothetical protein